MNLIFKYILNIRTNVCIYVHTYIVIIHGFGAVRLSLLYTIFIVFAESQIAAKNQLLTYKHTHVPTYTNIWMYVV